jgi:hypothetical protein
MKSFKLLLTLFITITLIYLVLCRIGIQYQYQTEIENFVSSSVSNNIPKDQIASKLGMDVNRIHKYTETGDVNDLYSFEIKFEIHPRTLNKKNNPTIQQIYEKINDMISKKEILKMNTSTGETVYLKNFKVEKVNVDNKNNEIEKEKSGYVDPEINSEIKYLQKIQSGFSKEISIEPRYKFNNLGKLELIPIPTANKPVASTPTPTRSMPTPQYRMP